MHSGHLQGGKRCRPMQPLRSTESGRWAPRAEVPGSNPYVCPGPERGECPDAPRTLHLQPSNVTCGNQVLERERTCLRPPSSASPMWGAAGSHMSPGMLSPSLSGCLLAPRMGNLPEAKVACLPARYKLVELLCYVGMGFFPALAVLSMVSPACPAWGLARSGRGPSPSPETAKSSLLL